MSDSGCGIAPLASSAWARSISPAEPPSAPSGPNSWLEGAVDAAGGEERLRVVGLDGAAVENGRGGGFRPRALREVSAEEGVRYSGVGGGGGDTGADRPDRLVRAQQAPGGAGGERGEELGARQRELLAAGKELGLEIAPMAKALGISRQTAYAWLGR